MAKIGVMGGTFDPIHNGHLALARCAAGEYGLDKILFMTGGNPPHKKDKAVLDASFRHRMVKLAVKNIPNFVPCDYEIQLTDYSYTANTLRHLQEVYPDDELYFIVGADSLNYVDRWYQPAEIFARCIVLVYHREGYDAREDAKHLRRAYGADIRLIHAPEVKVSSTQIRELVQAGKTISQYVPQAVEEFICKYRLYQAQDISWEDRLKTLLKPQRFQHSLGVRDTAVKMARKYGADPGKAAAAGLLHDCAKGLDIAAQLEMCRELDIALDQYEQENPGLIHAKLGAELIKCWFGITDPEIIEAVRWHTLGRVGMSDLAKIIFVADMVEPGREYPEAGKLRRTAFSGLDQGLYACVEATIQFNLEKGAVVHPNAYALRDWIKNEI